MDSSEYKEIIKMYEKMFFLLINIQEMQQNIAQTLNRLMDKVESINKRVEILEEKGANYAI